MTAKSRRELKQLFLAGAQPTAQDYSDVLDSGLNTLDDGISKPIEPHLPIRIKGISSGLPILDLYDDDTHNWRISLMSDNDSGYNIADPSGSSHFFLEDGTGDIGLGVTQPKAKLHINQSGSVGDALYIQDVANDQSPTRVSNAGHVYINTLKNTLKDGADSIPLEDASLYVNGSFHVVDEGSNAKSVFHVNESGAVTINGEAVNNSPYFQVNADSHIEGDLHVTGKLTVDQEMQIKATVDSQGKSIQLGDDAGDQLEIPGLFNSGNSEP